jgi:hypothetical protein
MTGDVVIDASRKSVYLKAYLASTESYFDPVYVLSATSGGPDCSEALRVSKQARAWCEASLAALEEHKLKGEMIEAQGMAPEEACSSDMLVLIKWQGRTMAQPSASTSSHLGSEGRIRDSGIRIQESERQGLGARGWELGAGLLTTGYSPSSFCGDGETV